jgi:hypothetical protein
MELAIEWDGEASPERLGAFADAFDRSIKAQNNDYTAKRSGDAGMAPPTVSPVPPGAFHAWMDAQGKLGGQHKCPRCANHRDFIEGVLDAAGVRSETRLSSGAPA